jgi:hypothetical protein
MKLTPIRLLQAQASGGVVEGRDGHVAWSDGHAGADRCTYGGEERHDDLRCTTCLGGLLAYTLLLMSDLVYLRDASNIPKPLFAIERWEARV